MLDRRDEKRFGRFLSGTDESARNVLSFHLEGEARVILRPSGTEPKAKAYAEICTDPVGPEATDEELLRVMRRAAAQTRDLADRFVLDALSRIDLGIPLHALRVSDLVSIDNKLDFAERFLPEFEVRAAEVMAGQGTEEDLRAWVDERLAGYGSNPRDLTAAGFDTYLDTAIRAGGQTTADRVESMRRVWYGDETARSMIHTLA